MNASKLDEHISTFIKLNSALIQAEVVKWKIELGKTGRLVWIKSNVDYPPRRQVSGVRIGRLY